MDQIGKFHIFRSKSGTYLRYFQSFPKQMVKANLGTILILMGRASSIEKYQEIANFFNHHHFSVSILDWRGQGGSERIASHFEPVHIDNYSDYLEDLDTWIHQVVQSNTSSPLFIYSVSMGALIAALYLLDKKQRIIERVIFVTPLFGLPFGRIKMSIILLLVLIINLLGFGKVKVPFFKESDFSKSSISDRLIYFNRGITYSWLLSTLKSLRSIQSKSKFENFRYSTLVVHAEGDLTIDPKWVFEIAKKIPDSRILCFKGTNHHIHHSDRAITQQLLKEAITFFKS